MDSFRPLVRFAGFEGEWEMVIADELFTTFNEKNFPNLPVLSATQDRGMVTRESFGYNIAHDKSNEATYKHVLPGQFVIHLRSFQGGFAHSAIEGIVSPAYTILEFRTKDEQSDLFWKYIFSSRVFINRLSLITYGIRDGRSINFNEFKELSFILPSLPEQQKISEYFTEIDRAISLQTEKLSKLKQIKAASLQNMFPQEGHNVPAIRFQGFRGEWKCVKLNSFAKRITRKNANLESTLALTIASAHGLVSQMDYFNNLVVGSNIYNYYLIKKGEFAYNKSSSSGYPFGSVKRLDFYEKGILSTLYIVFDIDETVSSDYVVHYFDSSLWHSEIAKVATEGARNHGLLNIGAEDFLNIHISLPSLPEQQAIANYFTQLDRQITLQTQKLEKLKQIKSACLSKMFV